MLIPLSGCKSAPPIMISCRFPPVPVKLVKRIQDRLFVEISELLPDIGWVQHRRRSNQKQRHKVLIVEWVQCFGIFVAILFRTPPDPTSNLLGYQQLIIQASSGMSRRLQDNLCPSIPSKGLSHCHNRMVNNQH